ncbi:MAG: type 4a pilus biogenesis protein PilO [Opitutaceae bacterium]
MTEAQQKKQGDLDAVVAILISAPQLRQELAFAQRTIQQITESLTNEESVVANTNYFLDLADQHEVRLENLRSYSTAPTDSGLGYKKVPFGFKVIGTFPQVAAFIQTVETGPRLSNITFFSFRKTAGASSISVDISVDLLGKK